MSASSPALLVAAAGVAVGHAVLPDHWLPLAVLGRARRYPLGRVARLSGLAGLTHVLVSIVLGAAIIIIGLQFRSAVQNAQDAIVGIALIGTGIVFTVLELTGRGHSHADHHEHHHRSGADHTAQHDHADSHDLPRARGHGLAAGIVPFGAAASPDLTILPVFLAATTVGVATAIGSVLVFGLVTVLTIVALTLVAARGGYEIRGRWLERWGNTFTAAVLVGIGALVLLGVI